MKTCYSISKPAMININQGVFTNKKLLFDAIMTYAKLDNSSVTFVGALKYEKKLFNYSNLNTLLNSILQGESFSIRLVSDTNKIKLFEITLQQFNKFL